MIPTDNVRQLYHVPLAVSLIFRSSFSVIKLINRRFRVDAQIYSICMVKKSTSKEGTYFQPFEISFTNSLLLSKLGNTHLTLEFSYSARLIIIIIRSPYLGTLHPVASLVSQLFITVKELFKMEIRKVKPNVYKPQFRVWTVSENKVPS